MIAAEKEKAFVNSSACLLRPPEIEQVIFGCMFQDIRYNFAKLMVVFNDLPFTGMKGIFGSGFTGIASIQYLCTFIRRRIRRNVRCSYVREIEKEPASFKTGSLRRCSLKLRRNIGMVGNFFYFLCSCRQVQFDDAFLCPPLAVFGVTIHSLDRLCFPGVRSIEVCLTVFYDIEKLRCDLLDFSPVFPTVISVMERTFDGEIDKITRLNFLNRYWIRFFEVCS